MVVSRIQNFIRFLRTVILCMCLREQGGQVKMRSVGWFGKVLGMKEGKYLVRNRILAVRKMRERA
jgi:hypothetical protein